MLLGYHTNGYAHHEIRDALAIVAEQGYRSAAITLEQTFFTPPDADGVAACVAHLKPVLERTGLRATVETGSRFILDPRRKHQPTLVSAGQADRRRRRDFVCAAIDVAHGLGADSVSLWSGTPDDCASSAEVLGRLVHELREVLAHADRVGMRLGFEPEPGMFVATMSDFATLHAALDHPLFGLTLDVGHVHCLSDGLWRDHVTRWHGALVNVHLEDMRRGVHDHLMIGEGEIDFAAVLADLATVAYNGPVHVELSRHSHDAVNVSRRAMELLEGYLP